MTTMRRRRIGMGMMMSRRRRMIINIFIAVLVVLVVISDWFQRTYMQPKQKHGWMCKRADRLSEALTL